ncbi:Uma2 family endonuclease [Chloroflexi bacterium TSY]|nr:Uma2 family endonuclease [Chloroflexi bacterium TSY]
MASVISPTVSVNQPSQVSELITAERPIHRFTLDEYHQLIENDFFQPSKRIELIKGVLVHMSPVRPLYAHVTSKMAEELLFEIRRQAIVRSQQPITLALEESEPEPDFAIVKQRETGYTDRHPYPEDILLVGEVSVSTLSYDRRVKVQMYAQERIPECWILNLVDNVLEIYRDPAGTGEQAHYQTKLTFKHDQQVSPLAFSECQIDLSEIIPK